MKRYQTAEFKISILLVFIFLLIPPKISYISSNFRQLEYGFLFKFLTIIQDKNLETNSIVLNLFNLKAFNFDILNFFLNIILIYIILIVVRKYFKFS